MSHPNDYHTFPEPSRAAASLKNNRETGAKITRTARLWKPPNSPLDEVPAATLSRISHRLVDRETGEAYSADEFIAMIGAPPDNPALNYEPETLDYLGNTGIGFVYAEPLDLFIKGLKLEAAWDDLSMWILDTRYQSAGSTVVGTGGVPINGAKENGLGTITESAEEYYFSRGTARIWTPTVLMPTSPLMSLMMVGKFPQQGSNFGSLFGGRNLYAGITTSAAWDRIGVGDGTGGKAVMYFENAATGGGSPVSVRKSVLLTLTGQRAGSCSLNGGALLAATSMTHDYSTLAQDTQSNIFGPGDYAAQSAAPAAASFVAFWRTNQSAKATAIYNLYKSTIGSHLSLP